jgi:hypothetical protein
MGPIVVRGIWYPYITAAPPDPWRLVNELAFLNAPLTAD